VTFARDLYDEAYFRELHPHHWFKNPPRKYAERNRDILRLVAPGAEDTVVELGCARGDIAFFLAGYAREVVGVDAADEALAMAEAERARRGLTSVEHVDDRTLKGMLAECRRVLRSGGRLGLYTPDRAHYVERMKAHDFVLRQFPQHIAVRFRTAYVDLVREAGLTVAWLDYSVSPFPLVRWVEKALAPLPLVGGTFRYRILLQAVKT
jgi:SAM-dependent methyltransferase